MRRALVPALLVSSAAAILVAGLTPFEFFPPNGLRQVDTGLHLDGPSIAYAAPGTLQLPVSSMTLELWLEPDTNDRNFNVRKILEIYDGYEKPPLLVGATKSGHQIFRYLRSEPLYSERLADQMHAKRWIKTDLGLQFVAITHKGGESRIYVDGYSTARQPMQGSTTGFLGDRLVLGGESQRIPNWRGIVGGLAMYERPLEAARIAEHGRTARRSGIRALAGEPGLVALYDFSRFPGAGAVGSAILGADLHVPVHYSLLPSKFLTVGPMHLQKAFGNRWDIVQNLFGFIPFGAALYVLIFRRWRRPAVALVVSVSAGAALSLAIEGLQFFMLDRYSSAVDLALNSVGTALGASAGLVWTRRRGAAAPSRLGTGPDAGSG